MTYTDIATMLTSIGLPYAYRFFPEKQVPSLPYIVFYYPNNDDFSADNENYVPIVSLNIELYTKNKDFATEEAVEAVLKENGFFYAKTEAYLPTERMYEVLYEMQFAEHQQII